METEWMHNFKIRCITVCCIILPIEKTQLALFMQEMNHTALFVLCCFLMTLYSLLMITTESLFLNYLNVCHSFCIFTLHLQTNMGQWHTRLRKHIGICIWWFWWQSYHFATFSTYMYIWECGQFGKFLKCPWICSLNYTEVRKKVGSIIKWA